MPASFVDVCVKMMKSSQYQPAQFDAASFKNEPKARVRVKPDGSWEVISNTQAFFKAYSATRGDWPAGSSRIDLELNYHGMPAASLNGYFFGGMDPVMIFIEKPAVLRMHGVAVTGLDPANNNQPMFWSFWYRIWSPSDMDPADRREYMAYRGLKYHAAGAGSEQLESLLTLEGLAVMGVILALAAVAAVAPWAKLVAAIVVFLRSLGFVCAILDVTYYRDRLNKFYAISNQASVNESQLEEGAKAFAQVIAKVIVDCGIQKAGKAVSNVALALREFFSSKNAAALMNSKQVAMEAENYEQMLTRSGEAAEAKTFAGVIDSVEHCQGAKKLKGSVQAQTELGLPRNVTDGYMQLCNAVHPPRIIVARAGNPESLKYFMHPKARPKPMEFKWKNAKKGVYAGTVVVPSKEKIIADGAKDGLDEAAAMKKFYAMLTDLEKKHGITLKPDPATPHDLFGAQLQVNGNFFISDVDNQAILIFEGGKWKPDPRWSLTMEHNDSKENQLLMNAFTELAKKYNQHGSQMNSQFLDPVSKQVRAVRIGDDDEKYLIICPGMKLFSVDGTQNLYNTLTKSFGVHVDVKGGRVLP